MTFIFFVRIYKKRELDSKKGINIYRKINCLRTHKSSLGTLKYSSRAISIYTSDTNQVHYSKSDFQGILSGISDKKYYTTTILPPKSEFQVKSTHVTNIHQAIRVNLKII